MKRAAEMTSLECPITSLFSDVKAMYKDFGNEEWLQKIAATVF